MYLQATNVCTNNGGIRINSLELKGPGDSYRQLRGGLMCTPKTTRFDEVHRNRKSVSQTHVMLDEHVFKKSMKHKEPEIIWIPIIYNKPTIEPP